MFDHLKKIDPRNINFLNLSPLLIDHLKINQNIKYYPVLIQELNGKFFLVDGVKRVIQAMREKLDIMAFVIHDDNDIEHWIQESLSMNENGKNFFLLQKICFLRFIMDQKIEDKKYYSILKIPFENSVRDFIKTIDKADERLIQVISNGQISDKNIHLWLNFKIDEILKIQNLIVGLKINQNNERKIVSYFWHLKVVDPKKFDSLLLRKDQILSLNLTEPKKVEYIIEELEKKCYPHLYKRKTKFKKWVNEIKLSHHVAIDPLDQFEENEFSCQFKFSSKKDFAEKLKYFNQLMNHKNFEQLFSIIFD